MQLSVKLHESIFFFQAKVFVVFELLISNLGLNVESIEPCSTAHIHCFVVF